MSVFTAAIIAGADDADQGGSTPDVTGTVINVNATTQWGGFRFQNVTIPQGATINSATLDVYLTSTTYDDPDVTIYGDDTDNAAAFTTTTNDLSSRPATTANVRWNAAGLGTGTKTTPDIATVIQEIVNRAGWASGNALAVLMVGYDSSTLLRIRTYEGDYSVAGELTVDYTASGGGGAATKAAYYARARA